MNETRAAAGEWVRTRNDNCGEMERTEVTPALGCKDSGHHPTSNFCGSEFRANDGT